jgi:hypothetical protein
MGAREVLFSMYELCPGFAGRHSAPPQVGEPSGVLSGNRFPGGRLGGRQVALCATARRGESPSRDAVCRDEHAPGLFTVSFTTRGK